MSKYPRFFTGNSDFLDDKFYLKDPNLLRHARKVLRLSKGDRIELFDGMGNTYKSEVVLLTKELLVAKIVEEIATEIKERKNVILAQALPKAGKIDSIVRMNTEIGVSKFLLFECDHSVVKIGHYHEGKITRLKKIIQEAARQSINNYIPQIEVPITFEKLLEVDADIRIILDAKTESGVDIKDIKSKLKKNDTILLCIGPEGGFSKREIEAAMEKGFVLVKLDLPVLRTETAGVVASAFLLL